MKSLTRCLSIFLCFFFLPVGIALSDDNKKTHFEFGAEMTTKNLTFSSDSAPSAVQEEAANPTIYHHRSGNTFTRSSIGTYDPGEEFSSNEWRAYLRLIPYGWRLRPFIELGVAGAHESEDDDFSTINGYFNNGYTYFNLLGHSGVDYIGYWYGIKYELKLFSPAIGLVYQVSDNFRVIARTQQQTVELSYQKGREAWGKPEGHIIIATKDHAIYSHSLLADFSDGFIGITIGLISTPVRDGVKGEINFLAGLILKF